MAKASSRAIADLVAHESEATFRLVATLGKKETEIQIPSSALQLLGALLTEFAKGNAVTMLPVHAELTTQQASDLLGVSRPFLVEQLEKGELPFRKVGTHRRVVLTAVKQTRARLKNPPRSPEEYLGCLGEQGLTQTVSELNHSIQLI